MSGTAPAFGGLARGPAARRQTARAVLAVGLVALAACGLAPDGHATVLPLTRTASLNTATRLAPTATGTPAAAATATASATGTSIPPIATATTPPIVKLMAVGDIMLGRTVGERIVEQGPGVPFAGVSAVLAQADLLVGNLECVITDRGRAQPKAYTFRAPLAGADALQLAGFDAVSLANNHSMDYGIDGLSDMLPRLRLAGIESMGAGADWVAARTPVVLNRNGVSVAFLAYVDVPVEGRTGFDTRSWEAGPLSPGIAWAAAEQIATDVAAARALSDVVVVLFHFGLEGRTQVTPDQQALARGAVDSGATLVLGAHAHVLQPVEHYKDGLIAYNLGNFVFDGFALPANYSAILTAQLTPTGLESFEWVPVVIEAGLPRPATNDEAAVILARLAENE